MSDYPQRPQLYALKYIRWLLDTGIVSEVGTEGFALLSAIVIQEDSQRYQRHVNFWTSQLCEKLHISRQTLISVRKRLVNAGLISYQPGARQRPGKYFTIGMGLDTVQNLDTIQTESKQNLITSIPIPIPIPKRESTRTQFKAPTQEEVAAYVDSRRSSVDPKRFWEYFDAGAWKDSKGNAVKNWKQKLITWENNTSKPETEATTCQLPLI